MCDVCYICIRSVLTGECFGNVITNNRIIQSTNHHSVSFGIANGSFIIGYIQEDSLYRQTRYNLEEDENGASRSDFDTLISGLGWLVRGGRNYIQQSLFNDHASLDFNTSEDISHFQSTGSKTTFAQVLSARTALGYDKWGKLLLLQVEGKTWSNGMSLYEFADF